MPMRSRWVLALLSSGVLPLGGVAALGCGARTGMEAGPGLDSPTTGADAGIADPVDLELGRRLRENPAASDPSGTPGPARPGALDPPATVEPAPATSALPTDAMTPPIAPTAVPTPTDGSPPAPSVAPTGSEPSTPVAPPVAPTPEEPPDTPSDPNAARRWLYVDDGSGQLIEVHDGDRHAVPVIDPPSAYLRPWSNDGSRVALFEGTTLSFVALDTAEVIASNDTGTEMNVFGWVESFGALISYYYEGRPVLYLGDPSGAFVMLGESPELSLATRATSSPTGSALLYATEYDGRSRVYWVALDGTDQTPTQVFDTANEVLGEPTWSPDGRWAAFDHEDTFWLVDASARATIAELGAGEGPVVFAPDSSAAALFDGDAIQYFTLVPGEVPVATTTLPDAESAPFFSADGTYLYYGSGDETASFRRTDDLGSVAFTLDDFAPECPLQWIGTNRFAYVACGQDYLAEGVIVDDSLITSSVQGGEPIDHVVVGEAQRCFAIWGGEELDVGATPFQLTTEFTRSPQIEITLAALSSSDSAVAWVEGGTDVYWLPLNDDCTVSSLPALVHSGGEVRHLEFISEWP